MPEERVQLERTARPVRFLAMRFAAKEAIVKGLGTGFAHGVWIRDVGIVQNTWGRPQIVYSVRGAAVRDRLGVGDGHVTLTDEAGLVVAVAVLMRASELNTLIFDIETVPDTELGRRLHGLHDLSDEQVGQIMFTKRRQEVGVGFPVARTAPGHRDLRRHAVARFAQALEPRRREIHGKGADRTLLRGIR